MQDKNKLKLSRIWHIPFCIIWLASNAEDEVSSVIRSPSLAETKTKILFMCAYENHM